MYLSLSLSLYIYIYIYIFACIYIYIFGCRRSGVKAARRTANLHSAKGGAVETGCSDLHDIIY